MQKDWQINDNNESQAHYFAIGCSNARFLNLFLKRPHLHQKKWLEEQIDSHQKRYPFTATNKSPWVTLRLSNTIAFTLMSESTGRSKSAVNFFIVLPFLNSFFQIFDRLANGTSCCFFCWFCIWCNTVST